MLIGGALLNKKLLVISGKGGTGKSLVSAALAMEAAAAGRRVLVVEAAAQSQLTALLGSSSQAGHQELLLRRGIWGINVSARECFREYISTYLGLPRLYDTVFRNKTVQSFINAIPGLGESMILGRLMFTCRIENPTRFDLVIFDAPASGHFLSMMQTPDTIIEALKIGPLVKELTRIREFLADAQLCAGLLVTTSEELVVSETLEFLPNLQASIPLQMQGVVINKSQRWTQESAEEVAACAARYPELAPLVEYVAEQGEKGRSQERQLRETLQRDFPEQQIFSVPDVGVIAEPLDEDAVARLLGNFSSPKGS